MVGLKLVAILGMLQNFVHLTSAVVEGQEYRKRAR